MSFMDGKHAFLVLIQCTFIKFDMQAMQYTCTVHVIISNIMLKKSTTNRFPCTHTLHSSRETSPVSKDHQWELFSVEVLNSLCCLVGGVWEPHLACLLYHLHKTFNDFPFFLLTKHRPHNYSHLLIFFHPKLK